MLFIYRPVICLEMSLIFEFDLTRKGNEYAFSGKKLCQKCFYPLLKRGLL